MRYLLLTCVVLGLSGSASAQTVVNPTTLEFTPSPDHNTVDLAGAPLVSAYTYAAIGMNSLGAVAVTINLGKPSAVGTLITMPLPGLSMMTVNAVYTATVSAVGPGGSGVSAPSNPFGVAGSTVPANPSNVRVR